MAVAGREAAFDFTDASDLRVTIRGVPFAHLLFEWVLSYSKWTYVGLALSETFEALVAGLQGALWMLGAVPALLRHDNLSAATHELKRSGGRQLTARFQQVMDHYGLRSSRIQPGNRTRTGWPSRRTSERRRPSSRRCCCGATETSRTSRRIWASCVRSSTKSGTGRWRHGWPRSVRICGPRRRDQTGRAA